MLTSVLLDFAEALRDAGIDPSKVEVSLPTPEWKALDRALAREHASDLFEGVSVGGRLNVTGVRYLLRFPACRRRMSAIRELHDLEVNGGKARSPRAAPPSGLIFSGPFRPSQRSPDRRARP
jgi:hypothetical protein